MKKLYFGILFGIFAMASFVALNMYTSTSLPGFGNESCNNCHNQPALVKDVGASFAMNNYTAASNAFKNTTWSADEVPTVQTNNRSVIEFNFVAFQKNTTHVMIMAQVSDETVTTKGQGSAHSDKFGLIFNIDVANFTVGQFFTSYTNGQSLDTTLSGDMMFPEGHADFWYVDVNDIGTNATGMAKDEAISTGILSDGGTHQDVSVSVWYISVTHGSNTVHEYVYFFVRALNTGDSNDAQFDVDGTAIHYAIAGWNDNSTYYHLSSFDQMIIVGTTFDVVNHTTTMTNTVKTTETKTVKETTTAVTTVTGTGTASGTTSSFTVIFVLAGLFVSIPIIARMRSRKE
jgi:hypothetical protein